MGKPRATRLGNDGTGVSPRWPNCRRSTACGRSYFWPSTAPSSSSVHRWCCTSTIWNRCSTFRGKRRTRPNRRGRTIPSGRCGGAIPGWRRRGRSCIRWQAKRRIACACSRRLATFRRERSRSSCFRCQPCATTSRCGSWNGTTICGSYRRGAKLGWRNWRPAMAARWIFSTN